MSFKNKLSIAFSLVLLLTIIVAMTGLWGMRNALDSQEHRYAFQNHIERTFHEMSLQEQAFTTEQTISHSRLVYSHISEMRQQITLVKKQARAFLRQEQLAIVLEALDDYETAFSEYLQQNLEMQTIRSRLEQEAKRLRDRIEDLADETSPGRDIYRLTVSAILAQKEFTLFPRLETSQLLTEIIDQIHELVSTLRSRQQSDRLQLQTYRVEKATVSFAQSFQHLVAQQTIVDGAHQGLRQAYLELREELSRSIAIEAQLVTEHIGFLQILTVTTALLAVLLSIVATLLLSDFITRPINMLKKSAREIVNGDLNTSVKITSRDEIGELGQLFNEMMLRLRTNFHELEKYRDKLEELVKERTHDLELEILERREAEKELLVSERRFRTFFDNSTDGILIADPKTQAFILANRTICSMLGYSEDELTSLSVKAIYPSEDLASTLESIREMAEGKNEIAKDIRMLRKDGSIFPAEITSATIDIGDQKLTLGCFRDISERKAVEAERLKIRKLESVGILAGGIAHDFNNILAAILGNASLALALTDRGDNRFNLLTELEKASLRARDLTQQLLTFSKGGEPVKELASMPDIIRESASFILRGSGVRCDYTFADGLWAVKVDAGQISQVIQNIVVNARHAMPEGGVITIDCRNVVPTPQQSARLANRHCLEIRIADSGPGIPEDLLEHIFDPYFTTKKEGSGLGLAITHSIINKHNGMISTTSTPGKGATFKILLPAIDTPLQESRTGDRPEPHPASGTIMIMDDELSVREVTGQLLAHLGYAVIAVTDGEQAVHKYQQRMGTDNPVDLVIMDLTIPGGMGGREAAEKILKLDPHVKLIVSSGYSQDPIMANYTDFGFQGFLSKPYQLHDLQAVLQQVLHS